MAAAVRTELEHDGTSGPETTRLVDEVIVEPGNIVEVAGEAGFSTLIGAATTAGLGDTLATGTVLQPSPPSQPTSLEGLACSPSW